MSRPILIRVKLIPATGFSRRMCRRRLVVDKAEKGLDLDSPSSDRLSSSVMVDSGSNRISVKDQCSGSSCRILSRRQKHVRERLARSLVSRLAGAGMVAGLEEVSRLDGAR